MMDRPVYAPWWKRVCEYLLRIIVPASLLSQIFSTIFFGRSSFAAVTYQDSLNNTAIAARSVLISVAVSAISVKNGQTWAHRLLRVRVVSLQGESLNGFHMFLRDLAHLPDFLFICLGFLWALWDRKKQTFADKICKTMVVAQ